MGKKEERKEQKKEKKEKKKKEGNRTEKKKRKRKRERERERERHGSLFLLYYPLSVVMCFQEERSLTFLPSARLSLFLLVSVALFDGVFPEPRLRSL